MCRVLHTGALTPPSCQFNSVTKQLVRYESLITPCVCGSHSACVCVSVCVTAPSWFHVLQPEHIGRVHARLSLYTSHVCRGGFQTARSINKTSPVSAAERDKTEVGARLFVLRGDGDGADVGQNDKRSFSRYRKVQKWTFSQLLIFALSLL